MRDGRKVDEMTVAKEVEIAEIKRMTERRTVERNWEGWLGS